MYQPINAATVKLGNLGYKVTNYYPHIKIFLPKTAVFALNFNFCAIFLPCFSLFFPQFTLFSAFLAFAFMPFSLGRKVTFSAALSPGSGRAL